MKSAKSTKRGGGKIQPTDVEEMDIAICFSEYYYRPDETPDEYWTKVAMNRKEYWRNRARKVFEVLGEEADSNPWPDTDKRR